MRTPWCLPRGLAAIHWDLGSPLLVLLTAIAAERSKATRGCQIDSRLCLDFCSLGGNLGCGDEYFRNVGLGNLDGNMF